MTAHKVTVRLMRRNGHAYKWLAECCCGWGSISWSWSRVWERDRSADPDQWVRDNGHPIGGAMINALEHVGLYVDQGAAWVPLVGSGAR